MFACANFPTLPPHPPAKLKKKWSVPKTVLAIHGRWYWLLLEKIQMTLFQIGFYVNRFLSREIKTHKTAINRPVYRTRET